METALWIVGYIICVAFFSLLCRFSRQCDEQMPRKKLMHPSEEPYHALAKKMNLIFNGFQESPLKGKSLPLFTHPEYGTFAMNEDESLVQAIERKREQFGKKKQNTEVRSQNSEARKEQFNNERKSDLYK